MNAGKSTSLLQVADNYEREGHKVALVKPETDTKGDAKIVSRLGISREVDILATPSTNIRDKVLNMKKGQIVCVLVDEAQFLTREQVEQLRELVDVDNMPVMAFGLRTDFQRRAFPGSVALFELADSIEEIKTVCRCMRKAIFNARLVDGKQVFEGEQVAIDGQGSVTYIPLCSSCYGAELEKATPTQT